ncbi:TOMM precursor leader peptide-binding protein [Actinophytocola glycyrrhizae]|uniref:TOMM leader peptide-binding protein n=1 Tax=Actinophytocola glycyrrhizae TaxID=2044873 RepID=A0ABV9S538_9PSEU
MTKRPPVRPRVVAGLPVLRRRGGELQIGLDPRHAVVVDGLPDRVVAAAGRFTGDRTTDELADGLDATERKTLANLLDSLRDHGLVEDATPAPARLAGERSAAQVHALMTGLPPHDHPIGRADLAVAVQGESRLAVATGCLLAAAGVGWVHVAATGVVRPEDVGTGYREEDVGTPRLVAARRALRRAEPTVRAAQFDVTRAPDLVVLTDALVPRPELVDMVMRAAIPHLLVRVRDTIGIVGPLVVPGLTSCLRCADLHRSDRDACWPQIAVQLAGQTQLTDLTNTQATAAFAVAQVLEAAGWLRGAGERPTTCETSVALEPRMATVRHRAWSAHPRCPCGAARHQLDEQAYRTEVAAHTGAELRQSDRDGDAS